MLEAAGHPYSRCDAQWKFLTCTNVQWLGAKPSWNGVDYYDFTRFLSHSTCGIASLRLRLLWRRVFICWWSLLHCWNKGVQSQRIHKNGRIVVPIAQSWSEMWSIAYNTANRNGMLSKYYEKPPSKPDFRGLMSHILITTQFVGPVKLVVKEARLSQNF